MRRGVEKDESGVGDVHSRVEQGVEVLGRIPGK